MGATNTTANYSLSQFIGTDKPAWLQDYNGDMLKIDTGINAAKVAADGAQNTASAAQNDATTANNAITNTINPAISSLNTTVGNQGGAINTINSLIGNGTPTTTDHTIIGAINEIHSDITLKNITIPANQYSDYGLALAALYTQYQALSDDNKIGSMLHLYNADLLYEGAGKYFRASASSTGFSIFAADLSAGKLYQCLNGTSADISSIAQSEDVVLYYR